jgi:hypothetical protein
VSPTGSTWLPEGRVGIPLQQGQCKSCNVGPTVVLRHYLISLCVSVRERGASVMGVANELNSAFGNTASYIELHLGLVTHVTSACVCVRVCVRACVRACVCCGAIHTYTAGRGNSQLCSSSLNHPLPGKPYNEACAVAVTIGGGCVHAGSWPRHMPHHSLSFTFSILSLSLACVWEKTSLPVSADTRVCQFVLSLLPTPAAQE